MSDIWSTVPRARLSIEEQIEVDRWLAEHDREVAERAWDDGYCAVPAEPEDREWFVEDAPNPHRSSADAREES